MNGGAFDGDSEEFDQRTAATGRCGADVAALLQQHAPGQGCHYRGTAPQDAGYDQLPQ